MSLASSVNPTIASDEVSAAAVSNSSDVSSPSLNAVRLDPDGCPGSMTPEPMYADIEAMQNAATPVARGRTSAESSGDAKSSGGSSADLQSISRSSLGSSSVLNNQPVNPFGQPTASDSDKLPSDYRERSMTLTRQSAKDSLAQLAKVIPPVAPKPPARVSSVPNDAGEVLYAEAEQFEGEWPDAPPMEDFPSPPPFDELPAAPVDEPTPVKQAPPPVSSKPVKVRAAETKQDMYSQRRLSQSLDALYSETRAALAKRTTVAEPELDDVAEMFPPPPPPEDCIYDEVNEPPPPPPPTQPSIPTSVSLSSDLASSSQRPPMPLPQLAAINRTSPMLETQELLSGSRLRSGSTDSVARARANRLPVQPTAGRARSQSRPLDSNHTMSMDV